MLVKICSPQMIQLAEIRSEVIRKICRKRKFFNLSFLSAFIVNRNTSKIVEEGHFFSIFFLLTFLVNRSNNKIVDKGLITFV